MAMIKCDACGAMMDPKGIKIHQVSVGELDIKYFRCTRCGEKYIGTITDAETRRMIREIEAKRRVIAIMRKNKMPEKSIKKSTRELETLRKGTLKKIHRLKLAYENGGGHEPEPESKAETGNSEGIQNP